MAVDYEKYFKRYEQLVTQADAAFSTIKEKYNENVRCEKGCSDCCHALFDLTLVEALYLSTNFRKEKQGLEKDAILNRADAADRVAYKLKRDIFRDSQNGRNPQEIMEFVAKARIRCPLLEENGSCAMYDKRPITCRLYGVPTAFEGRAHTCGQSGFQSGTAYPTVHIDKIQDSLYLMSHEFASEIESQLESLGEVLVPVSMALMTDYDDTYLGIPSEKERKRQEKAHELIAAVKEKASACGDCSDTSVCATCPSSQSIVLGGEK